MRVFIRALSGLFLAALLVVFVLSVPQEGTGTNTAPVAASGGDTGEKKVLPPLPEAVQDNWKIWLAPEPWAELWNSVPWKALLPGSDKNLPGVVAMVNGQPITLRQLETLYDMERAMLAEGTELELEELRAGYIMTLNTLIVQHLISQELKEQNLAVEPGVLESMEKELRADYAGNEFEEQLQNDGIALDMWREQLLRRLELELWQKYLRQRTLVTEEEVSAWLDKNPEWKKEPATVTLSLVQGAERKQVEAAHKNAFASTVNLEPVNAQEHLDALGIQQPASGEYPTLVVHTYRLTEAQVPSYWREEVKGLRVGQSSAVQKEEGAYRYLVLHERGKERFVSGLELYGKVEKMLMEDRLEQVFDEWRTEAVLEADIRVAAQLLPGQLRKSPSEWRREREQGTDLIQD